MDQPGTPMPEMAPDDSRRPNLPEGCEKLYMPSETARMLGVSARTVLIWARKGKIRCVRTPRGHRRYPESVIKALREGRPEDALPYDHATRAYPAQ